MTLKDFRDQKNLSQEALASIVGINRASVRRYEKGERIPDVNTAAKIGEVLGIPNEKLLAIFRKGE